VDEVSMYNYAGHNHCCERENDPSGSNIIISES
jgi:hypothetical protein